MQLDLTHLWFLHVWVVGREEWARGGQTARGRDPHFQCKGQCDVTSCQKYPRYYLKPPRFPGSLSFIPLSPFFLHCIHLKMLHRKDICLRCGEIHLSRSLYYLLLQCLKARIRRLKFTNINSNVRKLNSSRTREERHIFPMATWFPICLAFSPSGLMEQRFASWLSSSPTGFLRNILE